ncbi:hypothetical protein D1647_23350 [Alistipes sp. Z76]|nr:hypothetical protein [Alistipes sp. Z76]
MQFEELRAGVTFYEKRVDIRAAGCARMPKATQKPPKITPPSGAPTPRYMKTQKAPLARRLLY